MEQLNMIAEADKVNGDALISDCGKWRYWLSRDWDFIGKWCAFIMLNPSTADASDDDATIRRCIRFARDWGYGMLHVVNLFAYRATDPSELNKAADPVGPENDKTILAVLDKCELVIAAWGIRGVLQGRNRQVLTMLRENGIRVQCLSLTKDGHPNHPLYLRAYLKPFDMPGEEAQ